MGSRISRGALWGAFVGWSRSDAEGLCVPDLLLSVALAGQGVFGTCFGRCGIWSACLRSFCPSLPGRYKVACALSFSLAVGAIVGRLFPLLWFACFLGHVGNGHSVGFSYALWRR